MSRKIFLISCEASGDSHGADLVSELRKIEPDIECRGLGGPKMAGVGVDLLKDMTQISALGYGDVVRQYFTYLKIFYGALDEISRFKPDCLILIDSPAFNLRFAKKIRKTMPKLPIVYYISPQIWAWGARRIRTIKKTVDQMLTILPFEVPIYQKARVPCEFVGHPLLDRVKTSASREKLREEFGIASNKRAIGLLPGSRESEIRRILPIMLESAAALERQMPEALFFLTQSSNVKKLVYDQILEKFSALPIRRFESRLYDLVAACDFALVASGTATLETALLGTPFFLLYKAGWSTYFLGKRLIRVPYLGLVNILAGKNVVPEFIQANAYPAEISRKIREFLQNPSRSKEMREEFLKVREKLGEPEASARAARSVFRILSRGNAPKQTRDKQPAHT